MLDEQRATNRVADEIVSVLRGIARRVQCAQNGDICYAINGPSIKLRSVIFDRAALWAVIGSSDAAAKVEYLKRELIRAADEDSQYRYPRMQVLHR